ncbi:MAG: hypothetical protein HN509_08645 [Halobacteriovoraceae bacterium]|jgi:hypothetical protein|nr:hypothetical protein [Halobacteriovoraceae bacterium]MBT5094658.1 hypothetical protein [Halobacteriovoraceae bacterium]
MKALVIWLVAISIPASLFAESFDAYRSGVHTIYHKMEKGSLHKKGDITFGNKEHSEKEFLASISYRIKPRLFVPFPQRHRQGNLEQLLPIEFASEEGYRLLEERLILSNPKAELHFIGRETIGEYKDCYKIKVLPISGKWSMLVWYHPDVPSIGWIRGELTVNKIPLVGKYTVKSNWVPKF